MANIYLKDKSKPKRILTIISFSQTYCGEIRRRVSGQDGPEITYLRR